MTLPESITLANGEMFTLRAIAPEDAPALQQFHQRLSQQTVYFRFLENHPYLLDTEARHFTTLDYHYRMAILAIHEEDHAIVGVARYDVLLPQDTQTAEAAIVIEDRFHGMGLGTALMSRLTSYALSHGITYFLFTVHAANQVMLRLLSKCGEVVERRHAAGVYDIRVKLHEFASPKQPNAKSLRDG